MDRLDDWLGRNLGWAPLLCIVAGMAAGYLMRPWMDRMAAAARLWWEYVT